MASVVASEISQQFLTCKICSEDFKHPKMLPCLHTFCQPCLERVMETESGGKLSCPTCQQDVPLPKNGVQGLKFNSLVGKMNNVMEVLPKRTGNGEEAEPGESGVPCTSCDRGNPAEAYCFECNEYLCQVCSDIHSGFKASRSHRTITIQDLQAGHFATELRAKETSLCNEHNELNKFYCETCHRVVCLHCVVTAHKDHRYEEIVEAAERERAKVEGQLSTVKNTADLQLKWIEKLQAIKDKWSAQVQRAEEEIEKQTENIIETVKKTKDEKISLLRTIKAAQEEQLEITMDLSEVDLTSTKSSIQFTYNVLEYGSPAEVVSVSKELIGQLEKSADEKIIEKFELTKDFMDFSVERPVSDIEQEAPKLMGGIKQVRMPITYSETAQVRPHVTISKGDSNLKHIKIVGGKGRGDGQFDLPCSLVVTTEGDIVVADSNNKRLQFLDEDGLFKKKVDLTFKPWCVVALTNGELLVTGDGHLIHVLDKQGMQSRVIQVTGVAGKGESTKGIAVDRLGRIIFTIGNQVFVVGANGDIISKFGDKGRIPLPFTSSLRVAVNTINQIIISDDGNHTLKIYDPAGHHLFTCGSRGSGPGQLKNPCSVVTDNEDNIIVADTDNHRVSMFSRDGTFVGHVLTREEHGLNHPRGLTLTHDGRLVVSDCGSTTCIRFFL